MHHYIITGTSRGIGEALAYELLAPNHHIFCLSRSANTELQMAAEADGCPLTYYQQDLAQSYDSHHLMGVIMAQITEESESVTLIHNAAVLSPISPIGKEMHDAEGIVRNVNVNITSPMLMTDAFIAHTQQMSIPKRIINISSGAARKPKHAWSSYCSTKAALDMYSRCIAYEQQYEEHPIQVVSIAPGVVDTVMQGEIREQTEETFIDVEKFRQLKENNQLWSPDYVAKELIKLLNDTSFGEEVILDLRNVVAG